MQQLWLQHVAFQPFCVPSARAELPASASRHRVFAPVLPSPSLPPPLPWPSLQPPLLLLSPRLPEPLQLATQGFQLPPWPPFWSYSSYPTVKKQDEQPLLHLPALLPVHQQFVGPQRPLLRPLQLVSFLHPPLQQPLQLVSFLSLPLLQPLQLVCFPSLLLQLQLQPLCRLSILLRQQLGLPALPLKLQLRPRQPPLLPWLWLPQPGAQPPLPWPCLQLLY